MERPFSLGFSTGLTPLFLKSVGTVLGNLRKTFKGYLYSLLQAGISLLCQGTGWLWDKIAQCRVSMCRLSDDSAQFQKHDEETYRASTLLRVRASLHLSGNTAVTAPREDAVTPENLCSCTCKPAKLYSFSPKHGYSGRNIILICHGKRHWWTHKWY